MVVYVFSSPFRQEKTQNAQKCAKTCKNDKRTFCTDACNTLVRHTPVSVRPRFQIASDSRLGALSVSGCQVFWSRVPQSEKN